MSRVPLLACPAVWGAIAVSTAGQASSGTPAGRIIGPRCSGAGRFASLCCGPVTWPALLIPAVDRNDFVRVDRNERRLAVPQIDGPILDVYLDALAELRQLFADGVGNRGSLRPQHPAHRAGFKQRHLHRLTWSRGVVLLHDVHWDGFGHQRPVVVGDERIGPIWIEQPQIVLQVHADGERQHKAASHRKEPPPLGRPAARAGAGSICRVPLLG